MNQVLLNAIKCVQEVEIAFCKFITPNDTGSTGGHQSGFHISKNAWKLLFNEEGIKGGNKDKFVTIKWQDDFETDSRFIYYGVGTRNEYRITRFQRNFPFLNEDNVGDLLILCKISEDYYHGYILQTDDEMEEFFTAFNISADETNQLIFSQFKRSEFSLNTCFQDFIEKLEMDFPPTIDMANTARSCYNKANKVNNLRIRQNPDKLISEWLRSEYELFRLIENNRYSSYIREPFLDVEELVKIANQILNRRKSRAGKSLEHHLDEIFRSFDLKYDTQVRTEGKKVPDFIFPGADEYHNPDYNENKLIFLGAKTTCKDRWRQITNEADRIKIKYLFTLQQGINKNQLQEMIKQNVYLVIPKQNMVTFPKEFRDKISTLHNFIEFVKTTSD